MSRWLAQWISVYEALQKQQRGGRFTGSASPAVSDFHPELETQFFE